MSSSAIRSPVRVPDVCEHIPRDPKTLVDDRPGDRSDALCRFAVVDQMLSLVEGGRRKDPLRLGTQRCRLRREATPATLIAMADHELGRDGSTTGAIVDLIAADLIATLRWSQEEAEHFILENSGGWSAFVPRVLLIAEHVQQRLHDDRIDTTWPACPDHPHHPLRLTDKLPALWTCPSDGRVVCVLGNLSSTLRPDG